MVWKCCVYAWESWANVICQVCVSITTHHKRLVFKKKYECSLLLPSFLHLFFCLFFVLHCIDPGDINIKLEKKTPIFPCLLFSFFLSGLDGMNGQFHPRFQDLNFEREVHNYPKCTIEKIFWGFFEDPAKFTFWPAVLESTRISK